MSDNIKTLQVPSELDWLRDFYVSLKPRNVLEIGVWQGGTLRTWLQGRRNLHVVAVDRAHPNASAYADWVGDAHLVAVWGDSTTDEVEYVIRRLGPYDFVFIDGDHDFSVVAEDMELALQVTEYGAVIVLHDVVDADGEVYGPGRVLNAIERHGHSVRQVVHEGQGQPHGYGVVTRR